LSETPIGVLGSVRQLEGALESTAASRAASERRLEEARAAASRLLAAAREDARAAAAERRRVAIAAADDDAVEIARVGAETAARVQADAHVICSRVVETALALVLPADDESEA
jgi:vacuolar-type H+-ATPase subunit H